MINYWKIIQIKEYSRFDALTIDDIICFDERLKSSNSFNELDDFSDTQKYVIKEFFNELLSVSREAYYFSDLDIDKKLTSDKLNDVWINLRSGDIHEYKFSYDEIYHIWYYIRKTIIHFYLIPKMKKSYTFSRNYLRKKCIRLIYPRLIYPNEIEYFQKLCLGIGYNEIKFKIQTDCDSIENLIGVKLVDEEYCDIMESCHKDLNLSWFTHEFEGSFDNLDYVNEFWLVIISALLSRHREEINHIYCNMRESLLKEFKYDKEVRTWYPFNLKKYEKNNDYQRLIFDKECEKIGKIKHKEIFDIFYKISPDVASMFRSYIRSKKNKKYTLSERLNLAWEDLKEGLEYDKVYETWFELRRLLVKNFLMPKRKKKKIFKKYITLPLIRKSEKAFFHKYAKKLDTPLIIRSSNNVQDMELLMGFSIQNSSCYYEIKHLSDKYLWGEEDREFDLNDINRFWWSLLDVLEKYGYHKNYLIAYRSIRKILFKEFEIYPEVQKWYPFNRIK